MGGVRVGVALIASRECPSDGLGGERDDGLERAFEIRRDAKLFAGSSHRDGFGATRLGVDHFLDAWGRSRSPQQAIEDDPASR